MPYIKQELRSKYDNAIEQLVSLIKEQDIEDREGDLNYCITQVVGKAMKPEKGWRYKYLSRAHEVFLAAAAEFYRRLLNKYEDQAIEKNGDIHVYSDTE